MPDEALRQATFDTKAFQGPNGQFDRATFNSVLRNNGYTETRYLSLLRTDLAQRQWWRRCGRADSRPTW